MNLWDRLRRKPSMEEALLAGGVPEEDIQRAAHIGGLELLAIDRLLDEAPRNLSQRDIATEAGLHVDEVSQVWRALGFPHVEPDEPVYTRTDAEHDDHGQLPPRPRPDRRRPDPPDGPGHRPVAVPGRRRPGDRDDRPSDRAPGRGRGRGPVRRPGPAPVPDHARGARVRAGAVTSRSRPVAAWRSSKGRAIRRRAPPWWSGSPTWWASPRSASRSRRPSWLTWSAASRPWPPTSSRSTGAAWSRPSVTRSCSAPTTSSAGRTSPWACPSGSARRRSCPTCGSAWPTAPPSSTRATSTGRS